ncbi:MAG: hypothetical protein QOF51_4118, partial [Chloroflexota bacterium]|nr:hypothetical protein [Chloroflexota bacterium]
MLQELDDARGACDEESIGRIGKSRRVNADLSVMDDHGTLRPELAEAVPSAENGLWKVFPDGRMETTW